MAQQVKEYRYGARARQKAAFLLGVSLLFVLVLIGILLVRWNHLRFVAQIVGLLLLVVQLFTIRSQLGRLQYRCRILPDHLQIVAPLNHRVIPWSEIVEVRRMTLPQFAHQRRWACTVLTHSRRGTPIPTYIFDDQLERAEDALREIVQATPHAQHVNI